LRRHLRAADKNKFETLQQNCNFDLPVFYFPYLAQIIDTAAKLNKAVITKKLSGLNFKPGSRDAASRESDLTLKYRGRRPKMGVPQRCTAGER
jgi:hypothetical protein